MIGPFLASFLISKVSINASCGSLGVSWSLRIAFGAKMSLQDLILGAFWCQNRSTIDEIRVHVRKWWTCVPLDNCHINRKVGPLRFVQKSMKKWMLDAPASRTRFLSDFSSKYGANGHQKCPKVAQWGANGTPMASQWHT